MLNVITVMLVDDHEIVRAGFRRLLDNTDDISVIAEAATGEDAYSLYQEHSPDVVVMDLSMPPGVGGLEAIKRILAVAPEANILVLTVQECEPYPSRVLQAGAKGYLTKRCAPEELIDAVRKVYHGNEYVAPSIQKELDGKKASKLNLLTKRELQVFTQLAGGSSVAQIADSMFISQKTVHVHRSNILTKLELAKTSDLIHMAIRHGIVEA
ncbi:response regulator transcription factor [Motiliproteus sp. MSK22-1]|uniref:response regulator n=1 Tax=Motiliproteus sp. MSK22-1 TaxID=1897630 RepID=UPI0009F9DDF1|nr:response regulator transcription factor [Motiliproteus sp. MSK22-1]